MLSAVIRSSWAGILAGLPGVAIMLGSRVNAIVPAEADSKLLFAFGQVAVFATAGTLAWRI